MEKKLTDEEIKLVDSKGLLLDLVKEAHLEAVSARDTYFDLNESYLALKRRYEDVDRELAMLRRTFLPPTGTGKSAPSPPQLTIEQVKSIADKLGIKITVKEGGEC